MKKFLLYTIIFISLFVGTATCVIFNGYTNYLNQEKNSTEQIIEESPLTSLASNVLNSENYSGTLEISSTANNIKINGTFSYINSPDIAAQITLNGKANDFDINANIKLINNQIYIDFNKHKFTLHSNDITTALNSVLDSINTSSETTLPKLDMSYAQSLLSNTTTSSFDSGYLIQASMPNLCDIFITTNLEYIPSQILVTNIHLGDDFFAINIKASQSRKEIELVNTSEYLNISPALSYISPIINTFNQGNICIGGTLDLNGTFLDIKAYILNNNTIIGDIKINNFIIKYQIEHNYILIDLYGNIFKLTINDIIDLINAYIPQTIDSSTSTLDELINGFDLSLTVTNNKISNINASYDNVNLVLEIGRTLHLPSPITSNHFLNKNDITTLIDEYKNIFANEYSLDVNFEYKSISIQGNAYLKLNTSKTNVNSLYFSGSVNNFPCTIIYTPTETYLNINNNKIKLQNTTLEKVLEIALSKINTTGSETLDLTTLNNFTFLNNVYFDGRSILFSNDKINAKLTSYTTTYKFQASAQDLTIRATIYPSDSCYARIIKNVNKEEYKSFDNTPNLINALINTLSKENLGFSGYININILDFTYKNIKVDIQSNRSTGKVVITLDNLPTDAVLTYLNNTHYKNQKSIITIYNNEISIYTTVTLRATNKVVCIANKTLKLCEFSIHNLYDILSMRKSIIKTICDNSTSNSGLVSNLTTDCINIYKEKAIVDLNQLVPDVFNELFVEFYYNAEITQATLQSNINNILFINIVLNQN